jgi:hypothetical protein
MYEKECREVLDNGFKGFQTQAPAAKAWVVVEMRVCMAVFRMTIM